MTFLHRYSATLVWLVLASATATSWWFGTGHSHFMRAHAAGVLIMALAAVKAQLILSYFMEVRHAPAVLKQVSSLWVLAMAASIIGQYLFNGAA
jgi:hypothetical protein